MVENTCFREVILDNILHLDTFYMWLGGGEDLERKSNNNLLIDLKVAIRCQVMVPKTLFHMFHTGLILKAPGEV